MKKKSFLKKYMVFGLAVVLTMTVNLPVYAQETEEMTASVVEVQEEWSQQEENENQGNMALYETDPTAVNVASVDGVGYATLKDAVNAADGKVVELLSNVALTEKIVVKGSNVTLDLKGYTITGETTDPNTSFLIGVASDGNLTIQDTSESGTGKISANLAKAVLVNGILNLTGGTIENSGEMGVLVTNKGSAMNMTGGSVTGAKTGIHAQIYADVKISGGQVSSNGSDVNSGALTLIASDAEISGTAKLTGYTGIGLFNLDSANGVTNNPGATPSTVNISGGTIECALYAISGNCNQSATSVATITGGTLTASEETCIFWPMEGELNISDDAKIIGATGIEMKMGTLNVSGGIIEATGEYNSIYNNNGTDSDGSAIKIVSELYGNVAGQYMNNPNISVNITGGSLISAKGNAVSLYNGAKPGQPSNVSADITVGDSVTMNVGAGKDGIRVSALTETFDITDQTVTTGNTKITNTTLANAAAEAQTEISTDNAGTKADSYTLFGSVSQAVADAKAGGTVTVLQNVNEDIVIGQGKDVTIDLNQHTITGTIENNGSLELSGEGTLVGGVTGNAPTIGQDVKVSVAQVGDTTYTDLNEAAKAAMKSGQTLIVLGDTSYKERINVTGGTLNIDLNGHTIELADRFAIESGTLVIDDTSANASGKVTASNIATVVLNKDGKFVLKHGTVEGGTHGVFANAGAGEIQITGGKVTAVNAVCAVGNGKPGNMKVSISGGEILGENAAVITNGSSDRGGVAVNISGGVITATNPDSTAVYLPGINGEASISGGTITGATGVEIRAGKLHISGNPIIVGDGEFKAYENGSGATTTGVGVAVAQHGTKQPVEVMIGGNPEISGHYAFYEHNPQKNPAEDISKVEVQIDGGTFESTDPGADAIYSEDCTKFVAGGAFSAPIPEAFCEEGYTLPAVPDENGNYVVAPKTFTMTFDSAGGSAVDPITALFGNVFTAPADPERAGYTFDGWYAAGADVPFDFVNTKAAENLTLTAHWKLLAPEVGITVENTEPHIGDEVVLTANASHKAADVKYTYQWYKDGKEIAGADQQKYTAAKDGEYKVRVTATVDGQSTEATTAVVLKFGQYDQIISFENAKVERHISDLGSTFVNKAKISVKAAGTLSYASSNPEVADVDAASGMVTIKGVGKATITATAAETESHKGASASYELTVTDHKYDAIVSAPTCTEKGYTKHTCSICKDSYTDEVTEALGHKFENGVCTVCGAKDPQADPGSGQGEQNNGQGGQDHEQKSDPKPVAPGQNGNNGQNTPSAVKTGDEAPTAMWVGIVVISGLALIGAVVFWFRKRKTR